MDRLRVDLDQAEVGLGLEDLRALLPEMPTWTETGRVYISNGSRNQTFRKCPVRYWHSQRAVRRNAPPAPALEIGTAFHETMAAYIETGDRPAAVKLGAELLMDVMADPLLSETALDQMANAVEWVDDVMKAVERFLGQSLGTDCVLGVEEFLWAAIPVPSWGVVVFVGRADAIVNEGGLIRHYQHKTRSRRVSVESYATRLAFGQHEVGYGFVLDRLAKRRQFGPDVEYGGTRLLIFYKTAKPSASPIEPPKGLLDAIEAGHVSMPHDHTLERASCTDKQWEKARGLHENWQKKEAKRVDELENWEKSCFQQIDADLDSEKVDWNMRRLVWSLMEQCEAEERPVDWLVNNPDACEEYQSVCPYLESHTCGGWDHLDDETRWTEPEPDYVKELRDEYARSESDA